MRKIATMMTCVMVFSSALHAQTSPRIHELKATTRTVHRGFFDSSLKPVLTINSGDVVKLETASGNPRYFEQLGVPKEKIPAELYDVFEDVDNAGRGDHTLTGPIYINDAQPGDMLEIRIRSIDVRLPIAGQGFVPNRGLLPEDFPNGKDRVLWLDLKKKNGRIRSGRRCSIKAILGGDGGCAATSNGSCPERPAKCLRRKYG